MNRHWQRLGVEWAIDTDQWLFGFNRYNHDGLQIWNVFALCFRIGSVS